MIRPEADDARFMRTALVLAARGLGNVWPNPAVGCVLVRGGRVVGRGWTRPGGRPHAETEALLRAGGAALGAVAYVSFEPCAHYGHTPPCTMALIRDGVRRVVVATGDPDPRIDGKGIAQLRQAGVHVDTGVLEPEAMALNAGFLMRIREGRPLVTLKLAASLDARIATRTGASHWITGPEARDHGHRLRASHDAIMIGSGTALADDPELTCRLPGLEERSPVRIVVDSRLRVSPALRLARDATSTPVWLFTGPGADAKKVRALSDVGVDIIEAPRAGSSVDLAAVLAVLGGRGITRLLVEGGGVLAAGLMRAGLVDRIVQFQAPLVVGGDGRNAIGELGVTALEDAPGFERVGMRTVGADMMLVLERRA